MKTPDKQTAAAIALALHLYLGSDVHDTEPGVITIRRDSSSQWNSRVLGFRRIPIKK